MTTEENSEELEVVPVNLVCGIPDGKKGIHNRLLGSVYFHAGTIVKSEAAVPITINGVQYWAATCRERAHGTVGVKASSIVEAFARHARNSRGHSKLAIPMTLRLPSAS